ncbi:CBS domain-containing protein [Desulfotomaculum sp. 1211_IL3151]|uniref:CBS domain-containing protein n=1 Tax=Desulfotomaculum sp. 1211_IL3151 TaxID=3084055 RepID=UPI002FD8E1CF
MNHADIRNLECKLKTLILICIIIFLGFFFVQIVDLPFYNITSQPEYIIPFAEKVNNSMVKFFLLAVVFSIIMTAIVFRSNLSLNVSKDKLKFNLDIKMKDYTQSMDGMKRIIDDQGNIPLYNSEVYQQLTRDFIISQVNDEGQPGKFITMESYLTGFLHLCNSNICPSDIINAQSINGDKVFAPRDYVEIGDSLLTVITKMSEKKLTALPVVNKNGKMIGSINFHQVLKIVLEAMER